MENKKIKILCAEDEQEIRENIAEILRSEGFEVFEADNGKTGFDVFIKNSPDIIISDIMMPELDGYGLLTLIRENKNIRNNNVPFIFLTALGQKNDVIKGVKLSANDYLVKPIDFDLMIAKIKEKTANALKTQEGHNRNIKNIKDQIAVVLPNSIAAYLDVITQVSSTLKLEPYGPFPHRRYAEDLDRIYSNATKLRGAIANALDANVIEQRLDTNDEVISIMHLLREFTDSLSDKIKERIILEIMEEDLPRIKIDRLLLLDALRKIFIGMLKTDVNSKVTVTIMIDHLEQMIVIFYLNSEIKNIDLHASIDESAISKILDKQNCRFETLENRENTAILTIPSHRLVT